MAGREPAGVRQHPGDRLQLFFLRHRLLDPRKRAPLLLPPDTQFPDGAVFWLGGNGNTAFFDLSDSTWSAGQGIPMTGGTYSSAADAPAALLPDGHVLLAASQGYLTAKTTLYDFDPASQSYAPLTPPVGANFGTTAVDAMSMLVLPNGHVLFSSGNQLWDYAPDDTSPPATLPPITVTDIQPNGDGSFTLSGKYLTGFSEGAAQGDEFNGSATNYPIVKLTLGDRVWYANTTGWTPGVDDPTIYTNVQFTPPADMPAGTFSLEAMNSFAAWNLVS